MQQNTQHYTRIIQRGIETVGKEHVNLVVTDSAPVMVAAGKEVEEAHPHIAHQPCVVHLLDCFMEDVGRLEGVKKVVDDSNQLVNFVCNHHMTYAIFKEYSKLKLRKSCQTR